MGIICDTNIVLDLLLKREGFFEDAARVLYLCEDYDEKPCVSASSVTDIYYVCNKYLHSKSRSADIIMKLLKLFRVYDVNIDDVKAALQGGGIDFEDSVVAEAGKRNGCSCIVTRDKKGFNNMDLLVMTPSEFLKRYPQALV